MIYKHTCSNICLNEFPNKLIKDTKVITIVPKNIDFTSSIVTSPVIVKGPMWDLLKAPRITLSGDDLWGKDRIIDDRICIQGWYYKKTWFNVVESTLSTLSSERLKEF